MNGLYIEEHVLDGNTSLSGDIAKHITDRLTYGGAVIVAKQPVALLSSVSKQWAILLRRLEKERSSTLTATKIMALTKKIALMRQVHFVAQSPRDALGAGVIFATAEQLLEFAPPCSTMYVATPTNKETMHKITSFMPKDGIVVIYRSAI